MKKTLVTLMAVAVAGTVVADLSVSFKNNALFLNPGETTPINASKVVPDGTALVQLVWNASNAGFQDGQGLGLSLMDAGDVVLWSGLSDAGGARLNTPVDGIYGDSAVGGLAINTGYFFARVFSGAGVAGDYFVEVGVEGPDLTEYNDLIPTSTYSDSMGREYANGTSIDVQGTTVVPEPATLGLMGIAGLGMFLARRKARK